MCIHYNKLEKRSRNKKKDREKSISLETEQTTRIQYRAIQKITHSVSGVLEDHETKCNNGRMDDGKGKKKALAIELIVKFKK